MANFKTHVTVAAGLSWGAAMGCYGLGMIAPDQLIYLVLLGTLGGILPDIDSDHSLPLSIIFYCLYVLSTHAILINAAGHFGFVSILALCLGGIAFLRWVVLSAFQQWTRHRGILHSVLAAVFFTLLSSALAKNIYAVEGRLAWLMGCFIGFGYLVHLLLDEAYSIDFNGRKMKRSMGTAFKLWNLNDQQGKVNTGVLLALCFVAFDYSPDPQDLVANLDSGRMQFGILWEQMQNTLREYL